MATLFQLPKADPVFSGASLPAAKLYFFQAGTLTPIVTYTTAALSVQHAHPVVADNDGIFPAIFINEAMNSSYRMQLKTSTDVLKYDVDNLSTTLDRANIGVTFYPRTAAESSAGITPTYYYYPPGDVRRYGAVTTATDNSTAIQNAINIAGIGGDSPFVPAGDWTCLSSLQLKTGVRLYGVGYNSHLAMSGCAVVVSGITQLAHVSYWNLVGIRVTRSGSVGPAIQLTGDDTIGSNEGAIRGYLEDVYVDDSTGDGIEFSNAFLITCSNVNVRNTNAIGLNFKLGPTGAVSANAVSFYGGEIQACAQAMFMDTAVGISFFGTTVEGNTIGCDLSNNARAIGFFNCYMEGNGGYDIRAGNGATGTVGLTIGGGFYTDAASNKNSGIVLVKAVSVDIRNILAVGYDVEFINTPGSGTAVKGRFGNITLSGTPSACATTTSVFGTEFREAMLTGTTTFDPGSIAVGGMEAKDVTVTGAALGDFAIASAGLDVTDLTVSASVTAANVVTVVYANNTAGALDKTNHTLRVLVIPKSIGF